MSSPKSMLNTFFFARYKWVRQGYLENIYFESEFEVIFDQTENYWNVEDMTGKACKPIQLIILAFDLVNEKGL